MDTPHLFNNTAQRWQRTKANCLTDYTGRPYIFSLCGSLDNLIALDVGCGEGYGSRKLKELGARKVESIDISKGMIDLAIKQEHENPLGIHYQIGCATKLPYSQHEFDIAIAIFLYNYLSIEEMQLSFKEIYRVLKPGCRFILAIPHPFFPYMHSFGPPSYFNCENLSYFTARNKLFSGKTWCLDGTKLDVQLIHKTFQDYFEALYIASFSKLPQVIELTVTADHVKINPEFFNPLKDVPLHAIIAIEK